MSDIKKINNKIASFMLISLALTAPAIDISDESSAVYANEAEAQALSRTDIRAYYGVPDDPASWGQNTNPMPEYSVTDYGVPSNPATMGQDTNPAASNIEYYGVPADENVINEAPKYNSENRVYVRPLLKYGVPARQNIRANSDFKQNIAYYGVPSSMNRVSPSDTKLQDSEKYTKLYTKKKRKKIFKTPSDYKQSITTPDVIDSKK